MLSIEFIRENKEKVIQAAKNKNRQIDIDTIFKLDDKRRELIAKVQTLRQERNELAHKNPDQATITRGKEIKNQLKDVEA
jgi:seryl-tRNA synthetase